jgi:hypothetical protein
MREHLKSILLSGLMIMVETEAHAVTTVLGSSRIDWIECPSGFNMWIGGLLQHRNRGHWFLYPPEFRRQRHLRY